MTTDSEAVLGRIASALGTTTDADMARALEVRPSVVANWRLRKSVPAAQVIRAASLAGTTAEWIATGREHQVAEPRPQWQVPAMEPTYGRAVDLAKDDRLAAVHDWLDQWWDGATEDERSWLLVELRMLRRRAPRDEG